MVYLAFPIPPERFEEAARGLAAAGMLGLNCTIPHKDAALRLSDHVTEEAQMARAVNTLSFRADGIHGANTDIEGFTETLRHEGGFDFDGASVAQLGAGGAGRAMAFASLLAGASALTLANRTAEKAQALAEELRERFPGRRVDIFGFDQTEELGRALSRAELVVNATSLGLREGDPFPCEIGDLGQSALVFDAAYTTEGSTAWLRAAARRGLRVLDGLGMLVRQGAASFRIWTGLEADVEAMFGALTKNQD
jgi:shikimate dehydrogenase